MPIKSCNINNNPGYKWGDDGKCYTYDPKSESSKKSAKKKAQKQGVAAKINGYQYEIHTCGKYCGNHIEFAEFPPVHENCVCKIVDGVWETHPELTESGVCPICQELSERYNN